MQTHGCGSPGLGCLRSRAPDLGLSTKGCGREGPAEAGGGAEARIPHFSPGKLSWRLCWKTNHDWCSADPCWEGMVPPPSQG